jgi:hypothetical protein
MNKSQPFRQHQLTRALKAAQAAGGANPHVRVVLPNGTQLFLSGGEVEAPVPKVRGKTAAAVRDPSSVSKGNLPGSQNRVPLAEGGSRHGMFKEQAADPARPGRTGKPQSAADTKQASGGLSLPAKAGQCGT